MGDGMAVMAASDYEQVAMLWEQVGMWPHVGEDRAWFEAALARNPGCAFVWREGGRVVGTVVGAWDGLRGWIYHLAVSEPYRRRGLASALLAAAEARLHEVGAQQINLMVYEENRAVEGFYLRRGYEPSPVRTLRKRFCQEPAGGAA